MRRFTVLPVQIPVICSIVLRRKVVPDLGNPVMPILLPSRDAPSRKLELPLKRFRLLAKRL